MPVVERATGTMPEDESKHDMEPLGMEPLSLEPLEHGAPGHGTGPWRGEVAECP